MNQQPQPFNRAERVFGTPIERAEKGSAMSIIRAEADARAVKSERLRAMRLAREAVKAAEPVPVPVKTRRRAVAAQAVVEPSE